MKKQVIVMHGGDCFDSHEEFVESLKKEEFSYEDFIQTGERRWKDNMFMDLGPDYDVLYLKMPSMDDAKYEEWRIRFEKAVPFIGDNAVLIGHSLGGIFFARYLNENVLPKKPKAVLLVAAPYWLREEKGKTFGGFSVHKDMSKLAASSPNVYIFQSEDDPLVPAADGRAFAAAMPSAHLVMFKDRGHFRQEHFPEVLDIIKESL